MHTVKTKDVTSSAYPGLTAEAVEAREAALARFARWEADHPTRLEPAAAIAGVAALYDLLPASSRLCPPDPSGIMAFHAALLQARTGSP